MKKRGTVPEEARPRRTHLMRLRTVAAGSLLAAVSITGAGVTAAPASAEELRFLRSPLVLPGQARAVIGTAGVATSAGAPSDEERLLGIRADLANAVAWGTVTQSQADGFYAQMQARIARGL